MPQLGNANLDQYIFEEYIRVALACFASTLDRASQNLDMACCWQVFESLSSGAEQISRSSALPHQGSADRLVQQAAVRHTLRRGSKKMFRVQGLPGQRHEPSPSSYRCAPFLM